MAASTPHMGSVYAIITLCVLDMCTQVQVLGFLLYFEFVRTSLCECLC